MCLTDRTVTGRSRAGRRAVLLGVHQGGRAVLDARDAAVAEEQRHVDRAYERLACLRERAEQRRREALAAPTVTHAEVLNRDVAAYEAASRVRALTLGDEEPLVFGRLDLNSGEQHHVGRVSVLSEEYEPLVIDWRSDAAAPFYRATPRERLGVRRRRTIHCRGREVLGVEDELLDLSDPHRDGEVVGDAALMAAVTRERSARMRDIVATIQREQDGIIRLPARGVVIVSGGPGTGKTAVALHRAAYLLYRYRSRLERRGVLVVGPTRAFADYIAGVLPSLGETTAVLLPLGAFVEGVATDRHDPRDVGAVKGDLRMVAVLRRYAGRLGARTGLGTAAHRLRSGAVDLCELAEGILSPDESRLVADTWHADVRADRALTIEDVALIDELRALRGRREPRWEDAGPGDGPVDEVTTFATRAAPADPADLIRSPGYDGFGHVLVDEAQDLSAMQWRMVARRGRRASWTVVGDLAQRSAPGAPDDWEDIGRLLGRGQVTTSRLSVNYRTTAQIMELAAGLLPLVAPGQEPPRSARTDGPPPRVLTGVSDVHATAVAETRAARSATGGTVGVVATGGELAALTDALAGEDLRVLDPWTVKGLEFDAVVVVAPELVVEDTGHGGLYVALTRATWRLTVVTAARRLPAGLDRP